MRSLLLKLRYFFTATSPPSSSFESLVLVWFPYSLASLFTLHLVGISCVKSDIEFLISKKSSYCSFPTDLIELELWRIGWFFRLSFSRNFVCVLAVPSFVCTIWRGFSIFFRRFFSDSFPTFFFLLQCVTGHCFVHSLFFPFDLAAILEIYPFFLVRFFHFCGKVHRNFIALESHASVQYFPGSWYGLWKFWSLWSSPIFWPCSFFLCFFLLPRFDSIRYDTFWCVFMLSLYFLK